MFCLVICWGFTEPCSNFLGGGNDEGGKVEGLGFRMERFAVPKLEGRKVEGLKVKGLGFRNAARLTTRKVLHPRAQLQSPNFQLQFLHSQPRTPNSQLQAKILQIALSQVGVREATGKNDGAAVEAYLTYTGNKKGEPWCASFVSWVYGKAGFKQPRTAWSAALFPKNRLINAPLPASIFGIYYPKLKRIAHCGLVASVRKHWVYTIEGNTNVDGSREGSGVHRKLRHQRSIALYADWHGLARKEGLR